MGKKVLLLFTILLLSIPPASAQHDACSLDSTIITLAQVRARTLYQKDAAGVLEAAESALNAVGCSAL